jgi:hypothetical protein
MAWRIKLLHLLDFSAQGCCAFYLVSLGEVAISRAHTPHDHPMSVPIRHNRVLV